MGIRETINKNQVAAGTITGVIVLLVLGYIVYAMFFADRVSDSNKGYFTDDDGTTWFAADVKQNMPPFDHNGKQAVRCYVFRCEGQSGEWVAYLERYTPEAKARIEAAANAPPGSIEATVALSPKDQEVKLPHFSDKGWVKMSDVNAAAKIREPKCPDNGHGDIYEVRP